MPTVKEALDLLLTRFRKAEILLIVATNLDGHFYYAVGLDHFYYINVRDKEVELWDFPDGWDAVAVMRSVSDILDSIEWG